MSPRVRQLVSELRAEWRGLDAKIEALNGEFVELARHDAAARRLTSIPGVGVLNATALVAAVGDASAFAKARDRRLARPGFPTVNHRRQARLLGISKRGNTYRAHLADPRRSSSAAIALPERHAPGSLVVALAHKLARIAWATLREETTIERGYAVAA